MSAATATMPTLTPAQHEEVIGHLLMTAGPLAVGELKERLAEVENRINTFADQYAAGSSSWPIGEVLPRVRKDVGLARIYRARLATMARLGAPDAIVNDASNPSDPSSPSETEEVHSRLLKAAGQRFIDDLRRIAGPLLVRLKAELDEVGTQIQATHLRHASPGSGFSVGNPEGANLIAHRHDGAFHTYAQLVARRTDLEGRIASIEQTAAKGRSVQADLTSKAIVAAGGTEAIVRGVADSWKMQRNFYENHPGYSGLQARIKAASAIDTELAKLGGPDAAGSVADSLRADRETAKAAVGSAQSAIEAEVSGRIADLVDEAITGDEVARATIEQAARAEPRAFPSGFGDAIADAQFERSRIGALIHTTIG